MNRLAFLVIACTISASGFANEICREVLRELSDPEALIDDRGQIVAMAVAGTALTRAGARSKDVSDTDPYRFMIRSTRGNETIHSPWPASPLDDVRFILEIPFADAWQEL